MQFRVLFVVVAAFIASGNAMSATTENELAKISTSGLVNPRYFHIEHQRRLMRTGTATDATDEPTEERDWLKWAKVFVWLETKQTDEHVLKALKMNGLDEATMKLHGNYQYYEYFVKKALGYRINKWLRKDTTTWNVWKELGLNTQIVRRDEIKNIAHTHEFNIYARYVNDFDTYVVNTLNAGYNAPPLIISRGASDAEMYARVQIMARAKRDEKYAKVLLGLTDPSKRRTVTLQGNALKNHEDYQWFKLFQIL
ncbi:Avirulence (Avh) protein, partial [Phytophthora megakarya]